jgi:hypothetical protein
LKTIKSYENFVNPTQPEKGKLTIEVDDGQYDENWAYTIDVSKIWNDFTNNSISLVDFNNEYADLLMEHQQNISSTIGDYCWNEIEPVVADELRRATNEDESETIYNKLYDLFDKYEVYVNTGNKEEDNEIPTEV